MKVLVVCSSTAGDGITPFVSEQVASLNTGHGITCDFAEINSKGIIGYFKGYLAFLSKLLKGRYDIVHAHYGLSGLLACMQFFKPVVITFHGCDVNNIKTRWISRLAYRLCGHAIFVESEMAGKLKATKKFSVIPCGVNKDVFNPMDKTIARKELKIAEGHKVALFASAFDVPVKNYPLAKEAVDKLPGLQLIELKNYSRAQVNLLLNAADLLLLTSIREGSPQIIKEAMLCNCPVVTTKVGDVESRLKALSETYVCAHDAVELAEKMKAVFASGKRSNARENIFRDQLDLESVANRINQIYLSLLK